MPKSHVSKAWLPFYGDIGKWSLVECLCRGGLWVGGSVLEASIGIHIPSSLFHLRCYEGLNVFGP